jgi:hypothetical protein
MGSKFYLFLLSFFCANLASGQSKLHISSPASIAGDYSVVKALFGKGFIDTLRGDLIIAQNGSATTGNTAITNDIRGKIAIVDRGDSSFNVKARNVQQAGAIAIIVCNNVNGTEAFPMSGSDTLRITGVMMTQNDCIKLKVAANGAKGYFYFFDPTGAEPVLYSETFNGGKGAWTSRGVSNAKDTFVWNAKGISRGALGGFRIDAPTADNGAMVFDADFLTTAGNPNNIPTGNPPFPRRTGELISPIIDCSTFPSVTLKFFQVYSGLNYNDPSISYSTDGGATWSPNIPVNQDIQPNEETEPGSFLKIELPQLAGKAQARIKFVFDSDFYVWIIDDVKLLGKASFDIGIQPNQFFFPFNYNTPASQITTDTSTFFGYLSNFGLSAAINGKLKVKLTSPSGMVLHSDSATIANLPAGARDSVFALPKIFVPGKLTPGIYNLEYSYTGAANAPADADPTNNIRNQTFLISTDLYSKDDNVNNNSGLRANNDGNYFFGNLYNTSTDWNQNDRFKATDVTFGAFIPSADGTLKGKSATIYLIELLPALASDFNNLQDRAVTDNPTQMKIVGVASYEFKNDLSETPTVTLDDFGTFSPKVSLKKGTRYLLGVSYSDGLAKAYQFVETDIQYYYIGSLFFAGGQWSASSDAPVIRMRIELSTSNDELQLPESTLHLTPNPASDFVRAFVKFDKPTNVNFTMADLQGRLIQFQSKKNVVNESYEFDTSSLPSGTYLMRISTDKGTRTKKFIVAK